MLGTSHIYIYYMSKSLNENKIIELYNDSWSASKISRLMKVETATIINRLNNNNIEIRQYRKYLIEENYFEQINNQTKSYWVGFLMADGYNNGKFIRIDIQDKGHLDKLREVLYTNNDIPIREKISSTDKIVYYLTINNKRIVRDCENLGIVKRKSFICEYPNINSDYDKDFIRGVFDGDGSLCYSMDGNYRRYTFSIVGSKKLMEQITKKMQFLEVNIVLRKMKSIHNLYVRGF